MQDITITQESNDTPSANLPAAAPREIVFVDSRVQNSAQLLQGMSPQAEVVVLQAGVDGLAQIAAALGQGGNVGAVHIIAHGNAGDLWLGNSYLSAENLAGRADVLAAIGKGVNAGGDILVYACNTAEGERGATFVNALAQLTGHDVAASDNRTGAGGDWTLEIATGSIEHANVLSAQAMADYQLGLATWTAVNNANIGVGSLRDAIASAQNGDIVTFNAGMTVLLTSTLTISKNITLDGDLNNDGVADVTLDGQYKARVLDVTASTSVSLDGLVITHGLLSANGGIGGGNGGAGSSGMAGGISNAGNLTLNNVSVIGNAASGGGGGGGGAQYSGGGGGGGGMGGQGGGRGGNGPGYNGSSGGAGVGGNGGGAGLVFVGRGGSSIGGAGASVMGGYSKGGNGGTATNGSLSIGGGGGGGGQDKAGGAGGDAVGGIFNASGATLTIVGTSSINNNVAAGGGGGGGGTGTNGGIGGIGVGAIWNKGTLQITAANVAAMTGNAAASGVGGFVVSGGSNGATPTSTPGILNDGGTYNPAYSSAPTVSIVVADSALKIGETSLVTFTFSSAVSGFTNADLTVANGTLSTVTSSDGITWTATLTPTASLTDATNVISVDNTGYVNGSSVAGSGVTMSNNYAIDTVRPTATIVMADTALKIGETSLVTIAFSEAVSGFTNADLTIANGTLTAVSSSDGGLTWTATLTPTASITDATNLVTLDNTGVSDLSGNAGAGTTDSNNYAIDTARPSATLVVADNALTVGETSLVTITFSEAVIGFTKADLTIANGTVSTPVSSDGGITWTATLTPSASVTDATNLITLDNTGLSDLAGNTGSGTTDSNNYAIDTLRPSAGIVVADNALRVGETSLVTITFSEAVTGFTNADLTIANGTLTAVSSSDGGVTWTATLTPTTAITDSTNLITLDNTGVQDIAGNPGAGTTNSNNYAIDTVRPTATIVVADNALTIGETSLVMITFSEAVSGFTNADLTIANGTLGAVSSGDGGISWTATFTPTVAVTDTSNVITLDNTGVSDLADNAGSGTSDSNNYVVDTVRPSAAIVVADTALTAGETSLVTITFSEAVTGFTNADLSIASGTLGTVGSSDGGITWTATFTPAASVTDTTNLIILDNTGVSDVAGNAGTGSTNSNNYAIDTVRPTATVVLADSALKIGDTSLVTITFSEAVTGFTNADLTIASGTLGAVSSGDGGLTWTATFTPANGITDTSNLITLDNAGVVDLAGNAGSGTTDSNNYAIDTARAAATIVVNDSVLTIGETSLVTITFAEAVTGLTNAALTVANGTLGAVSSADGGLTWTATLTPGAGISHNSNLITLDNTGISDLAGNAGSGTTDSNNYAIDTVRAESTIVVADSALNTGETSLVTITFTEAVSGFTNADLTIANGTLGAVSSSDGGITWTATLTPASSVTATSNQLILDNSGVTDLAGNAGTGSTGSNNYAVDTLQAAATITVADSALKTGDTSLVTITFSEAVTGFTNADLTVANATLGAVSSSDGGMTWTAMLTPAAGVTDTSNLIILDNTGVSDLAGNAGTGSTTSNNYTIDMVGPSATIVVADSALRIGDTSLVTITFTEAVTGFSNADLTFANATLGAMNSVDGGITWTATLTPAAGITNTSNLIILDNTGVSDVAGNAGSGTTDATYAIDTLRPGATIVVADSALKVGATSQVTIAFTEAVGGFTNADLSIANGSLSAVSSSDGGRTWTATLTPAAGVSDTSNLITLDNSGVSDLAGNAGSGTTGSNNYAIDTVRPAASIVVADSLLQAGETSLVTITFNVAVSGLTNDALTVANGMLSPVSSSDGGLTWTATLTPAAALADASNLITLDNTGMRSAAGNPGSGSTDSNNYQILTERPSAGIVIASPVLAAGQTSLVNITFSEAVSGFDNADLTIDNGMLTAVYSSDGGQHWSAILTPAANVTDTTNFITLDNSGVLNVSGNAGLGKTISNNYVLDTKAPVVTSVTVPANMTYKVGQALKFTVNWSEEVAVNTAAGVPRVAVALDTGGVVYAAYQGGSGTRALVFSLTVAAGHQDLSGITLDTTIDANGATLSDAFGKVAVLGLNGVPATTGVLVDAAADSDTIPSVVEDQAPGLVPAGGGAAVAGDGNGDGAADSQQAAVTSVAFLYTAAAQSHPADAASVYVTLVADSNAGQVDSATSTARLDQVLQLDAPANQPADLAMPLGLIAFKATVATAGQVEDFSLYVDSGLSINGYWKLNATGAWVNLASAPYGGKVVTAGGKTRLDFHITDGGEFDADGHADGVITDPGAAGFMPLSLVGHGPDLITGHFWF